MSDARPTVFLFRLPDRPEVVTPERITHNAGLANELAAHTGIAGRVELLEALREVHVEDEYRIMDGHRITPLYVDDGMSEKVTVDGETYRVDLQGAYAEVFAQRSGKSIAHFRWDGKGLPPLDEAIFPELRKALLDTLTWMSHWPYCSYTGKKALWSNHDRRRLTVIGQRPSKPHALTVYEVLDDRSLERFKIKPGLLAIVSEFATDRTVQAPIPAGPVAEQGGWMVF